jgi:competence protein ComEC
MIVSHDDIDHTGGAISVLQALPVGWLATSLPELDPLPLFSDHSFRCYSGQQWEWDGVRFEVLHPSRSSYERAMKDNDRSCVLRITAAGRTVLLTGDIERRSEEGLLSDGVSLAADVLIAPHQGSNTSSTPAFVGAVRPAAVIFPVGYRNRFGHPHAAVVERYRQLGSALYRTDSDGAVMVAIRPEKTIEVDRYRAMHRRYWLDAPHVEARALDAQLGGSW